MVKTRLSDFQDEILRTGGYRTHDECRAAKRAKPGWWVTLKYSWGVMRVFPYSGLAENFSDFTTAKWIDFCFSSVTVPESLGMNIIVEGFEHRRDYSGPVMYVSNHMSMTETILLPTILTAFTPISYVAKASLAHLPGITKAAAHMGMVPVSRTSPRQDLMDVLRIGTERINAGNSFLIYPQGTRCEVFSRSKFSSIGAKLAERAGVPIVPIVVDTRCQPTRKTGLFKKILKDFGPVDTGYDIRVAAGPLIPVGKSKVMHEASFDWMADKLSSWGMPVDRGVSRE